jgi:hypothetical protein
MIYVEPLIALMDSFLAVIDLLQEREYGLEDIEKGKTQKMYAFNSMPRIVLAGWTDAENKAWVCELKQEKEDDFIISTHLNPTLRKYKLPELDGGKVEAKEVEKKEAIADLLGCEEGFAYLASSIHSPKITPP